MYYLGAHVSTAGGPANAVANARAIGANAFALFLKNQKTWNAAPLSAAAIADFKQSLSESGQDARHVLPHDGYLINLANPDEEKRRKSLEAFVDEMERAALLGLDRINFHPGATLGLVDVDAGLTLVAQSLSEAMARVPGVRPVIETTAGQGSNLGNTFEQLATIIERTQQGDQVGVCIDTCHIFAAGYDLRTEEAFEQTMGQFASIIGFDRLMGMHLNDAKSEFASKVDRHAPLGSGNIGITPFRMIMQDRRFEDIPLILETTDETLWAQEIEMLRGFAR